MITKNYNPRYVKHALGSICVFFTLFGCWVRRLGWGVVSQEIGTQPACAVFHLGQLKNQVSETIFISYRDQLK